MAKDIQEKSWVDAVLLGIQITPQAMTTKGGSMNKVQEQIAKLTNARLHFSYWEGWHNGEHDGYLNDIGTAEESMKSMQARIELLEKVVEAADKCKDGCRRCDSFSRYDELKTALAALKEQT